MSPHIQAIIKLCLKYIIYDPNYNYDADDDEDDSMDIEDREDEDQGDFFLWNIKSKHKYKLLFWI